MTYVQIVYYTYIRMYECVAIYACNLADVTVKQHVYIALGGLRSPQLKGKVSVGLG